MQYDAVSRLDVSPGTYEIRIATAHHEVARTGSVYTYIEVPDFAKEPLALSGIVLQNASSPLATPSDAFKDVVPITPTSRREFTRKEPTSVFVRAYQGGTQPVVPTTIRSQIVDAAAQVVLDSSWTLEAVEFGNARAADFRLALPLERLSPGSYLLTIQGMLNRGAKARRDLKFVVQ